MKIDGKPECEGADWGESEDEETSSIYSCPCPGCAATPPTQTNIREIIEINNNIFLKFI